MAREPKPVILVAVPGCIFNLRDFSNAREVDSGESRALKIEFKKGTYLVLPEYTLADLDEAFRSSVIRS